MTHLHSPIKGKLVSISVKALVDRVCVCVCVCLCVWLCVCVSARKQASKCVCVLFSSFLQDKRAGSQDDKVATCNVCLFRFIMDNIRATHSLSCSRPILFFLPPHATLWCAVHLCKYKCVLYEIYLHKQCKKNNIKSYIDEIYEIHDICMMYVYYDLTNE